MTIHATVRPPETAGRMRRPQGRAVANRPTPTTAKGGVAAGKADGRQGRLPLNEQCMSVSPLVMGRFQLFGRGGLRDPSRCHHRARSAYSRSSATVPPRPSFSTTQLEGVALVDWYKNFAKDFLEGTAHMSNEEVGVYKRLLDHQWCRGGRLSLDRARLAALVSITPRRFERMWDAVLNEKFDEDEDGYFNPRLERERLKAEAIAAKRRKAGRKGADSRWSDDASDMANAIANGCDSHRTRARARRASDSSSPVSRGKKGVQGKTSGGDVELPDVLDTPAFRAAWSEWLDYRRRDKRKAVTERAATMQLKKLAEHGPVVAAQAIEQSIANDWQGVFPEKVTAIVGRKRRRASPEDSDLTPNDYSYLDG